MQLNTIIVKFFILDLKLDGQKRQAYEYFIENKNLVFDIAKRINPTKREKLIYFSISVSSFYANRRNVWFGTHTVFLCPTLQWNRISFFIVYFHI